MSDPDDRSDAARLRELEERIARIRGAKGPEQGPSREKVDYSQAELAWRMVIEFVAGLMIGFGIGYGLDSLFGTMPIFLVLFIFLGLAAGIRTMLASAKEVQRKQAARAAERTED